MKMVSCSRFVNDKVCNIRLQHSQRLSMCLLDVPMRKFFKDCCRNIRFQACFQTGQNTSKSEMRAQRTILVAIFEKATDIFI